MARSGILYSQVVQAAAQLAAAGKSPTVDAVREALGDTGSKSTIAPMLKRWKAEHQGTVAEVDSGLPAELVEAVKSLHGRLQDEVKRQLEQARDEHEAALAALALERDAARADRAQLRQAHDLLLREAESIRVALQRSQQDLQASTLALTAAQTENAGLQQRLADRVAEVGHLHQQLTQARSQFEHFQEATARQRASERQADEQRIARLEQDLTLQRHRHDEQQAVQARQELMLVQQEDELAELRQAQEQGRQALAHVSAERERQAEQLLAQASARAELERQLALSQQALSQALAQVAAASRQADLLAVQVAQADKRAEQAERDKAAWVEKLLMWQAEMNADMKAEQAARAQQDAATAGKEKGEDEGAQVPSPR